MVEEIFKIQSFQTVKMGIFNFYSLEERLPYEVAESFLPPPLSKTANLPPPLRKKGVPLASLSHCLPCR